MKKIALGLLSIAAMALLSSDVQAHDPFAFQFGYTLGYQNSYRYRVPAPPYFALHPPVYYGQRYYRPYGESPFASWPLLQANPTYRPEPARGVSSAVIVNPHCSADLPKIQVGEGTGPIANASQGEQRPLVPQRIVIVNPYALEHLAKTAAK
jgi:hypothetical protein